MRISFYKSVATFVRAYADIAQDLTEAGYSEAEAAALQKEVEFNGDTRAAIKKHSGEELDIKPYETDMRRLLNTYVQADPAADVGNLDSLSLTELIIETGIHDAIARKLNEKCKLSRNAIAEGIGALRGKGGEALDVGAIPIWKGKTTLALIGGYLGITRERVRQLQNETILKIRSVLRGRDL